MHLLVGSFYKRHAVTGSPLLRPAGRTRFQDLFHSPRRGAFHLSLTVLVHYRSAGYLALGRGRPCFPPDSSCPVVLTFMSHARSLGSSYGTLTRSGRPFQQRSPAKRPRQARGVCRPLPTSRSTPSWHRRQPVPPRWFGLLPVRSPLLRESSLFLGVLRCFSSPGSPCLTAVPPFGGGLPHSETVGSPGASPSPTRFVAWPRPSSAQHA